jgi:hypothetical protein
LAEMVQVVVAVDGVVIIPGPAPHEEIEVEVHDGGGFVGGAGFEVEGKLVRWDVFAAIEIGRVTGGGKLGPVEGAHLMAVTGEEEGEIVAPVDEGRCRALGIGAGVEIILQAQAFQRRQFFEPLRQAALQGVRMAVDVKQRDLLAGLEMLKPAPRGHAMVVTHIGVFLAEEKVHVLTSGGPAGGEGDEGVSGHGEGAEQYSVFSVPYSVFSIQCSES